MLVDPALADRFIAAYMGFLGTLLNDDEKRGKRPSQWLVLARSRYLAQPALLDAYRVDNPDADGEILDAIAKLRVERWVYLKDTRSYSVWLDQKGQAGYGVLGLTERLRTIVGGSGVAIVGGLLPLQGRWVTDSLIEELVVLCPNYRRDFTATYQDLRTRGGFSLGPPDEQAGVAKPVGMGP